MYSERTLPSHTAVRPTLMLVVCLYNSPYCRGPGSTQLQSTRLQKTSQMSKAMDPNSGFCRETSTFHSLHPPVPLPPPSLPLSIVSYAFSLLPAPLPPHPALLDATSAASLTYPHLISQVRTLSHSLQTNFNLSKGDVAFILSPSRLDLPVLYLSLLSIGAVVTPANPASTPSEISRLLGLVNPAIAFALSSTAPKLPVNNIRRVVLLDSPEFSALFDTQAAVSQATTDDILQTDAAVIQFSSGTTGSVKAAALSHRNFIAMVANMRATQSCQGARMLTAPMFHSMGFISVVGGVAMGTTTVVMNRPGFSEMLAAMERYRVKSVTAAPPVVVAMGRSDEVSRFDLGAMAEVVCGGAPLSVEAAVRFNKRFPGVLLRQVK